MMIHHYTKYDQSEILSGQTFTEVQNLQYDLDLEYSNPVFSLDTSLHINHQIEFGCKRLIGLELMKDIVETVIF